MRRLLCHEPRGHADMYGCFIVPPDDDGADFGVLFWHKDGYSTACGHGTIALGAWAVECGPRRGSGRRGGRRDDRRPVGTRRRASDVPRRGGGAGRVPQRARLRDRARRRRPATSRVDVAYGGAIYAFVPAAELGLPLSRRGAPGADPRRPRDQGGARRDRRRRPSGRPTAVGDLRDRDPRASSVPLTTATSSSSPTARSTVPPRARRRPPAPRCSRTTASSMTARAGATTPSSARRSALAWSAASAAAAHRGRGQGVPDGRAPFVLDPRDDLGTGFVLR